MAMASGAAVDGRQSKTRGIVAASVASVEGGEGDWLWRWHKDDGVVVDNEAAEGKLRQRGRGLATKLRRHAIDGEIESGGVDLGVEDGAV